MKSTLIQDLVRLLFMVLPWFKPQKKPCDSTRVTLVQGGQNLYVAAHAANGESTGHVFSSNSLTWGELRSEIERIVQEVESASEKERGGPVETA